MEKILSVRNLGKSFKDTQIIRDITFEVKAGEIMAVLGPNGAGKSTTIRNIMGILIPDEGEVEFHNHPGKDIPRQKIGYLPEERGLYKNVSIMDVLMYFAELKDYPLEKARKRALEYLEKFDLKGKEKSKVEELSKGMAQKVQFIGSIIHEPELLILDEPFSGLDPVSQEVFKTEIKHLTNNGTAILLSSHQMNMVEELCDRLFMIHRGQRVIYGPIDEVKAKYANFKCTLHGNNNVEQLKALPDVMDVEQENDRSVLYLAENVNPNAWLRSLSDDLDICELSLDRISLHEIFIRIATGRWEEGGESLAQ